MSTEVLHAGDDGRKAARAEREKLKMNTKKVADVVKGVAVAYVGFQLGMFALKFIGRKLSGKRPQAPARIQRSQSIAAPALLQAATLSEDTWTIVDAPAPDTPDGYKPIVNAVLPCSSQELYGILFSGAGTELYLKQHREVGKQWDLVATGWRRAPAAVAPEPAPGSGASADGSLLGAKTVFEYVVGQPGTGGFTRLLTFWNPKKPPSTVDTRCVQRQQFCVYRGGVLLFATAMNMLDIPFKECFTVNTVWRLSPGAAAGTCSLTIHLKVNFIKRAMGVGGIISATTFRDSAAFFTAFVANVDAHVRALRDSAGTPLPAPLPAGALHPAGSATLRGARSQPLVSPFAAASATVGSQGLPGTGPGASVQPLAVPAWKQLRALLVIAVMAFTVIHQLQLGREIAALRGEHTVADGGGHGSGHGGGGSLAGGLVAAALGPVATAAGSLHLVLQALVDRVGGRAAAAP